MYMLDQLIPAPQFTVAVYGKPGAVQQMARVHAFAMYRYDYWREEMDVGVEPPLSPKIVPITFTGLIDDQVHQLDGSFSFELPHSILQDERTWVLAGFEFKRIVLDGDRWAPAPEPPGPSEERERRSPWEGALPQAPA